MCVYYARIGKDKDFIRNYVEQYYNLDFNYEELKRTYYHGEEICQNTVPQAIHCFLISNSFEDCLRTTISIGGDCDTTAAISCAIAEAYYKEIPTFLAAWTIKNLPKAKHGCNPTAILNRFEFDRLCSVKYGEEIVKDTKFVSCFKKEDEHQTMSWFFSTSERLLAECVIVDAEQNEDEDEFDYLDVIQCIKNCTNSTNGFSISAVLDKLTTENVSYVFFKNLESAVAYQATLKETTGTIEQIFTQEYEIKEN